MEAITAVLELTIVARPVLVFSALFFFNLKKSKLLKSYQLLF